MKFLTLRTPDIVHDQSCDCGKLKCGSVKTHVIIAAIAILGVMAILAALLLSRL